MSEQVQVETCPRQTPWGYADHVKQISAGIWSVSTPSHGGIYVAPSRRVEMPACLSDGTGYSSDGWFEEDADWALACAAFPVEFGPRACHYALQTILASGEYLRGRRTHYVGLPQFQVLRAEAAKWVPEEQTA